MRRLLSALLSLCMACYGHASADETVKLKFPDRHFSLHRPVVAEAHPAAVIVLHGGGGGIEGTRESTGMNETADRHGFLAVYPAGSGTGKDKLLTWNAGGCCGYALEHEVDDVAFLKAVADYLVVHEGADPERIYLTGISNGAMMAYRAACEAPGLFAAIAPVSGQMLNGPCDMPGISVLHIHGTADRCARYEGGKECGACFSDFLRDFGLPVKRQVWSCPSVVGSIAALAEKRRCTGAQPTRSIGSALCASYDCRDGAQIELCSIEGGGHSWPGGKEPSFCQNRPNGLMCNGWRKQVGPHITGFEASEEIWDFFSHHPRH